MSEQPKEILTPDEALALIAALVRRLGGEVVITRDEYGQDCRLETYLDDDAGKFRLRALLN